MDNKKIHDLLNGKFEDDDIDENDLEDELEAILSGKIAVRGKAPVKLEKARPSRNPATNVGINVGLNKPLNDPTLDISHLERMLNNFDIENLPDDENIDDHDLMSELDDIVANSSSHMPTQTSTMQVPDSQKRPSPLPINQAQFVPSPSKLPKVDTNVALPPPLLPSRPQIAERTVPVVSNKRDQQLAQVKQLQIEYKRAALKAKTSGDKDNALAHMKISKQLEAEINRLNSGEDIDMSSLPPMPQESSAKPTSSATSLSTATALPAGPSSTAEVIEFPDVTQEDASKLFPDAPKAANSILEALQQRLEKFKSTQAQATAEQNASKARRLGRIVKQYEVAIKDHKAGKPVEYEELPAPPGFPPIPTGQATQPAPVSQPSKPAISASTHAPAPQAKPQSETPPPKPAILNKPATAQPQSSSNSQSQPAQKPPLKRGISTTGSRQLKHLIERQKLFKEAALEAKKRGEMEQAKEYLRTAKGFDPLIEATRNGLPIDVTSIPTPPQLNNDDFVIVDETIQKIEMDNKRNSVFYTDLEKEELFRKIEKELIDQIEMCNRNKEYFIKMGDISTSNKFEKYANESRKDLNMLVVRWRNGDNIPSYKTETRTFSIVVSNHEVGINELQVEVIKAFDLPGKPEIDTYVRVELPFPSSEKPQFKKTKTVYNTINPEYNESITFEIDRKSRSLARILKRHPLKLEIFSKGGFLRSDTRLGSVQLKLGDLETKCTIHECTQISEARKTLHGRLEFKVKLREPLLAKQIEEIKEKWIVFA